MNAVRGSTAANFAPSPHPEGEEEEEEEEFDETGPRPPTLPGKEQRPVTPRLHHHHHRQSLRPTARTPSPPRNTRASDGGKGFGTGSNRTLVALAPALTPRKSSYKSGREMDAQGRMCGVGGGGGGGGESDGEPPLGYEPEGSARERTPQSPYWETAAAATSSNTSPPPYLRWAVSLRELLRDGEGVALFKRYLQTERCEDSLDFWFACEGLKKKACASGSVEHQHQLHQLIKVIYRKYLRSHSPFSIGAGTRRLIVEKMTSGGGGGAEPDCSLFDGAQREVEEHISKSTYPNFLKSDLYLQHVQCMLQVQANGTCSGATPPSRYADSTASCSSAGCSVSSSRSSSSSGGRPDYSGALATVLEDCELAAPAALGGGPPPLLPLTSRHLIATQRSRAGFSETRRPEAFAGMYLQQSPHSAAPNPYHAMYSTFIPASAQDSELQSLSSGAHTDETVSLTDSSLDGCPTIVNRKYQKQQLRAMRQNARQNLDPLSQSTFIPRTERMPNEHMNPKDTEVFATFLIEKLEAVIASQDKVARMDESLRKIEYDENKSYLARPDQDSSPALAHQHSRPSLPVSCGEPPMAPIQSALLSVAMREKLISEDDQSILDDHVSRIWDDSAHCSPARSPGPQSPGPPLHPAPLDRRRVSAPPLLAAHQRLQHRSRERDGASLHSGDSGAVPDYVESAASGGLLGFAGMGGGAPLAHPGAPTGHHHRFYHLNKSRMIGELVDMPRGGAGGLSVEPYGAACGEGGQRRSRGGEMGASGGSGKARGGAKKFIDSSDSGVSVAYEPSQQPIVFDSQEKVISWVLDSKKYYAGHPGDAEKESSSSRHKRSTYSTISTASPGPNRQGRGKKPGTYSSSRSGSLERGGHPSSRVNPLPQPSQPFMTDPSMPILPPPNTTTQLEEARRRLEDDSKNKLAKSRSGLSSKDRAPYPDVSKSSSRSASGKMTTMMGATSVETFVDDTPSNLKKSSSKKPASSLSTPSISAPSAAPSSSADTPVDYTVVLYNFSGELVPYRSKLAGKNILLRQFKSLITKKGNFRYFFKNLSDDVETGFVYEEANDDNDLLPLWEGKIFALLESID